MKSFIKEFLVVLLFFFGSIVLIVLIVPHPYTYFKEQAIKDKLLSDPNRPQSLVLLGGSNVAYGFLSQTLQQSLNINVINDGFHAGLGLKFMIENCSRYLKNGDVLVICPEYENFLGEGGYGEPLALGLLVLGDMHYFKTLNFKQLKVVAKTTPFYMKTMIPYYKIIGNDPNIVTFNEFGDYKHFEGEKNVVPSPERMENKELNEEFFKWFADEIHNLEKKGIQVFFYPPAFEYSHYCLNNDIIERVGDLFDRYGFSPLCDWEKCVYPDSLFYDTRYHLNGQGALNNSNQLVELLKPYIQKNNALQFHRF